MNPFPYDKRVAEVRYSDYKSTKDLITAYPDLSKFKLVNVEYVCPADDLHSIPTDSQDFLIASHVFEHLPNPIKGLEEFYRVCKNKGIIYLTVPEKTCTGDKFRPRTPLSHMIDDYRSYSSERDLEHFREFVHMSPLDKEAFENETQSLQKSIESFHYHVFLEENVIDIIDWCNRNIAVNFEIIDHKPLLRNNPADLDFSLIIRCHK
jgi:ubiquinone/menaquinone biosynthesis C-methylase UbiE